MCLKIILAKQRQSINKTRKISRLNLLVFERTKKTKKLRRNNSSIISWLFGFQRDQPTFIPFQTLTRSPNVLRKHKNSSLFHNK